jgi:hypothetical protein
MLKLATCSGTPAISLPNGITISPERRRDEHQERRGDVDQLVRRLGDDVLFEDELDRVGEGLGQAARQEPAEPMQQREIDAVGGRRAPA